MNLLALVIGAVLVVAGVLVIPNPRLQLNRDVGLINSEEVGTAERITGIVAGLFVVLVGLGFLLLSTL